MKPLRRLLTLTCVAVLVADQESAAQQSQNPNAATAVYSDTRPRVVVRPRIPFSFSREALLRRAQTDAGRHVIVKFSEGAAVRLEGARWVSSVDVSVVQSLCRDAEIERLFSRPATELDVEREQLSASVPVDEPPLADLNNYYRVRTQSAAATEILVNALAVCKGVETAYPEPVVVPADDIPPRTPNLKLEQLYLREAPYGFGYDQIDTIVGARNPDGEMAQLEANWIFGHEDCRHLTVKNLLGKPPAPPWNTAGWANHGSACVGIMTADRNGYGVTGFASATKRVWLASMTNGAANMVSLATAKLGRGAVMSSSVCLWIQVTVGGQTAQVQTPLDFHQAEFDAIRTATTKGIFYTLSGGNGHIDLGNRVAFGSRYLSSSVSSGAFILAATNGWELRKATWSCYGKRIDANGWGGYATTTGYGGRFSVPGDARQSYTWFGGTSCASAMLAGTIASLVGAAREQLGRILTLNEVRLALKTEGTAIPGPDPIGLRPDLLKLFVHFGIIDGLLITKSGPAGSSFDYSLKGRGGEAWGTLISIGRGRTALAANRPLLLDTSLLLVLEQGTLPPSGIEKRQVSIPNQSALIDVDLYLQTMFSRKGSLYLSNSAELWIH